MILQTLMSLTFLAVIAGALLTSALVNVKVASRQMTSKLSAEALTRGTNEFVNWAQIYVAKHGANTDWPTTSIVDEPILFCSSVPKCSTAVTISYNVVSASNNRTVGPDPITNIQSAVFERRIAANISVQLTGPGTTIVSSRTLLVMARVLNAPPFVILTGIRDLASMTGPSSLAEGDNAGYFSGAYGAGQATPNPEFPEGSKDTTIMVNMSCVNSVENSDSVRPSVDNRSPGNDGLPWGASGGVAFEAPCSPEYHFSSMPAIPSDYNAEGGNRFEINVLQNSSWNTEQNGSENWVR